MEIIEGVLAVGVGSILFLWGRYCGYKEGLAYSMHRVREMFGKGLD